MAPTLTPTQKKDFFKLSWPLFIEVFLGLLTGYLSTLMLSTYSDTAAGLVSVVNQMISLFYLVFMIVSTGTGILMAQSVGAKSANIKEKIATASIFYAVIIGFIGTIIVVFFGESLLTILNLDSSMISSGTTFAIIVGIFFIMQAIAFVISQIIYSYGFTKVGMFATFVANTVNLLLNWALIFGVPVLGIPSFGILGAAIGSVIGRIIYFVFIFVFLKKKIKMTLSAKTLKPFPKKVASKIFRVGFPATAENISYVLAQLVITGFVISLGSVAMASKAYFESIAVISWAVSFAVGGCSAILIGQLTGARENEEARKIVRYSLKISIISTIIPAVLLIFISGPLGSLFTSNPEIIAAMKAVAIVDVILQIGRAINMILCRGLKATGDTRYPLIVGIIVEWFIMIPLGYLLCFTAGLGLVGIWIAITSDEVIRAIFMLIRWKSTRWESKTIVKTTLPGEINTLSL